MEYADINKRIRGGMCDCVVLAVAFSILSVFDFFGLVPDSSGAEMFIMMSIIALPQPTLIQLLLYPDPGDSGYFIIYIVLIAIEIVYYSVMDISTIGGTIGRRDAKTSICNLDGTRPSILKILLRSFLKTISRYLLFVPCLTIFITPCKQALHDILAGTVVIDRLPKDN